MFTVIDYLFISIFIFYVFIYCLMMCIMHVLCTNCVAKENIPFTMFETDNKCVLLFIFIISFFLYICHFHMSFKVALNKQDQETCSGKVEMVFHTKQMCRI